MNNVMHPLHPTKMLSWRVKSSNVSSLFRRSHFNNKFKTKSFVFSLSGISVTADKIATILKAAGVSVEPYWPTLFAKALDGVDIGSLLGSLGSAASAVSAGMIMDSYHEGHTLFLILNMGLL